MSENSLEACGKCGVNKGGEQIPLEMIGSPMLGYIQRKVPDLVAAGFVCTDCLNHIRAEYVQELLAEDRGQITALEKDVIESIHEQDLLAKNMNVEFDVSLTLGQRVADKVAEFGGSWMFISIFAGVLLTWIAINSMAIFRRPFDPYPFILLNLVLSCLAAVQAPIIMMSQNRHAEKDRMQADHDYKTNLKAELEIRQLHWKIDQLLMSHWRRLLEIQEIQTELMEQIAQQNPKSNRKPKVESQEEVK